MNDPKVRICSPADWGIVLVYACSYIELNRLSFGCFVGFSCLNIEGEFYAVSFLHFSFTYNVNTGKCKKPA